ncbi:MAG: DMT family transporter [Gemmatimonadetes bacterium]|nr:MAG: DMT family transporter [Gemmatimonadota bacterium]
MHGTSERKTILAPVAVLLDLEDRCGHETSWIRCGLFFQAKLFPRARARRAYGGAREAALRRPGGTDAGLALMALIWGANFTVIKAVLEQLEPLALNALRFPLAALALGLLLRLRGPLPWPRAEDRWRIVWLGVVGNVLYQLLFIFGIDWTLAGNAALLLATTPVWTLVLSTAVLGERYGAGVWAGVCATLVGMVLVVAGGPDALDFSSARVRGDVLMVGASLVWSIYTVGAQDLTRRYGSLAVTTWTLRVGAAGLVALGAVPLARRGVAHLDAAAWGGVAYAGVLAIAVAYALWYRGVEHIGSSRTAVYSNAVPVVALAVAWVWLGERPTPLQVVGAAVIVGGVAWARTGRARRERAPAAGPGAAAD